MCAARNEYFYNKLVREEETKLRSPNVTVIANRLTRSKKREHLIPLIWMPQELVAFLS
jgi:hypothetical protein